MKFRICLLSITCYLLSAVQVDAGQNSNAVISLDYVASGQGNQTDDGVMSGTVSGRGTTIIVEVFAKNVSTSLSAVEILFKSSSVLTYVGAENSNTFLPVNLSNGVALTFANPLTPSVSGEVFLAKAEFTTLLNVSNSEFKIEIEKVKLVENINNFDEITSSNEIVFNRTSATNGSDTHIVCWEVEPIPGDLNYDGIVGIPDFLILVDNFGKTGPVPVRAQGGLGGTVVISLQEERAEKLLGFWKLRGSRLSLDSHYLMGYIFHEQTLDDGELTVLGSDKYGVRIIGGYSTKLSKYTILDSGIILNLFYVFNIQGDRAVGSLYFYSKDETVSDARIYELSTSSGRTHGEGFRSYASKTVAIPIEPDDLHQLNKVNIPQDIIDAHNRLKAILDQ